MVVDDNKKRVTISKYVVANCCHYNNVNVDEARRWVNSLAAYQSISSALFILFPDIPSAPLQHLHPNSIWLISSRNLSNFYHLLNGLKSSSNSASLDEATSWRGLCKVNYNCYNELLRKCKSSCNFCVNQIRCSRLIHHFTISFR